MKVIEKVCGILDLLYKHGWDERNGGNLSYILSKEEEKEIIIEPNITRIYHYDFSFEELISRYIIITGTSKYFKNAINESDKVLGIFKVIDESTIGLVWGLSDGMGPTSEAATHLLCHNQRMKQDKNQKIVIHCHPTNLIAMTHIHDLDEDLFTIDLWKMQTESIVVFPEGVGVLPWMICGGKEIALKTIERIKMYRAVIWAYHGIFAVGDDLDDVFGLIETIEKAASIYLLINSIKMNEGNYHSITNEELKQLADNFNVKYKKII